VRSGGAPFRLPGGATVPVLAALVIVWLLSHATAREFGVEASVIALAAGLYFMRKGVGQT